VDVLGIWCEWKTTEDQTNHHYSAMEMSVPPGAGVPLHRDAIQETFTVLDGSAEFGRLGENGEEWLPIATGDVVNVPNWSYHGFRNSGDSPARIQLTCPAGLEAFFASAEFGSNWVQFRVELRNPRPTYSESQRSQRSTAASSIPEFDSGNTIRRRVSKQDSPISIDSPGLAAPQSRRLPG
jgi:quercetin dioxygenase-like cupin family protein